MVQERPPKERSVIVEGQVSILLGLSSRLCRDITTGLMRYGGVSKEKYEKLKKEKKSYDNNIYLL